MTWRNKAKRVIAAALQGIAEGTDKKQVRKILSEAYPFGERAHYPYTVWCEEVNRAMGKKKRPRPQDPETKFTQLNLF